MFPLTNDQKAAIQNADEKIFEMVAELENLREKLESARVPLPHKNEEGINIMHGSNMQCHRRAEEISHAINILRRFV